jgi:hypothetical protein
MSKTVTAQKDAAITTVRRLVDVAKLDVLYRDLYFQRARTLLDPLLSRSSYSYLKENLASLTWVERQLRAAVERGDWKRSQELTEHAVRTRASATANAELMKLGEEVYDGITEVVIDPFSVGFHVFTGGSTEKLLESRNEAIQALTALERADPEKKDFYARRRADFQSLSIKAGIDQPAEVKAVKGPAELQQEALSALESGDLSLLEKVVQKLMNKPAATATKQESAGVTPAEVAELGDDLNFKFSDATLAAAKELGLRPIRTKSRRHFAHLVSHRWQPSFMKSETRQWSQDQISRLTFPSETTDKSRDTIEFYLLNPFLTSAGTRYQVNLVEEDLLVEDFPEPDPKEDLPQTPLLSALGLENRRGLSRTDIENAVLQHGPEIVQKLSLDPEVFRLIAIPPDLYSQLGRELGWGQKEMWTHFDGYRLLEGGKVQALVGGDKRFGGTSDVVGLNSSYSKDSLIARFAVVQRKRMASWHKK